MPNTPKGGGGDVNIDASSMNAPQAKTEVIPVGAGGTPLQPASRIAGELSASGGMAYGG